MPRLIALGFVAAVSACLAAAIVNSTACIVAPPPQLAQPTTERPTILHDAVAPPTDQILPELPSEFVVPVDLADPDESFEWDVFVDYNPCVVPSCTATAPTFFVSVQPTPGTVDGGIDMVSFSLTNPLDPSLCHRIDFLVAHQFDPGSAHTWDSLGGDIVTWFYNPGGQPNGCPVYDAGAFQDGSFPLGDAGTDGLPVIPESGTGDP